MASAGRKEELTVQQGKRSNIWNNIKVNKSGSKGKSNRCSVIYALFSSTSNLWHLPESTNSISWGGQFVWRKGQYLGKFNIICFETTMQSKGLHRWTISPSYSILTVKMTRLCWERVSTRHTCTRRPVLCGPWSALNRGNVYGVVASDRKVGLLVSLNSSHSQ